MTRRKGGAAIYQISAKRWVAVEKIKGSLCWLATECYPCEDAPTGWYKGPTPYYVEAGSEHEAAGGFSGLCRDGKVALLVL